MTGVEIVSHGHYAPQRIVPNSEIEARLGLEAGWIKRRTGIEARRYVAEGEALSDIAVKAGEMVRIGPAEVRRKLRLRGATDQKAA